MELALERPRIPVLTSLRFFAALHVVLFHLQATKIAFQTGPMSGFAGIGYTGVSLFFVLSGFILVYTYAGRTTSMGQFYRARFARIYPAYAFSLLLTAPFFFYIIYRFRGVGGPPFFIWPAEHPKLAVALVVTLLQSWVPPAALAWNSVAWSLSVEAFFYVLFPFLLPQFEKRGSRELGWMLGAFWLAGLAVSVSYVILRPDHLATVDPNVLNSVWLNVVKFNPLARLPEFLIGMTCGMLFIRNPRKERLAASLVAGALIALVAVAAFWASIPYPILHTGLLGICFAALIYGLALQPSWSRFMDNRVLVLFGEASYSLYLLHQVVIPMFFFRGNGEIAHPTIPWIVLAISVALGVSLLVYRFIEQPLRRKLNPRRAKVVVEETAAVATV
jgi:peptidoglycan/LPS O-acetylase OafA/YrhL